MKTWKACLTATVLVTALAAGHLLAQTADSKAEFNFVPWPESVKLAAGDLTITAAGRVVASDKSLAPLAQIVSDEVYMLTGVRLSPARGSGGVGDIVLAVDPKLQPEAAYTVAVGDRVTVTGGAYLGAAHGTALMLQAIRSGKGRFSLPKITVQDRPYSEYYGTMVDIARQNNSLEELKGVVNMMRLYRLRFLQLHMSDDQSWTFPSTAFPKLGKSNWATRGGPVPKVYTVEQWKELVRYADERGVTFVPEIETPGHSGAARRDAPEVFGPDVAVMNMTNPRMYEAMDTIIGELCEVFKSSPYIHIGCDECNIEPISRKENSGEFRKANGIAGGRNTNPIYQEFDVSVGLTYTVSYWARVRGPEGGAGTPDPLNSLTASLTSGAVSSSKVAGYTADWTKYTFDFKPTSDGTARLSFVWSGAETAKPTYNQNGMLLDDVVVTAATTSKTTTTLLPDNLIQNGGFEKGGMTGDGVGDLGSPTGPANWISSGPWYMVGRTWGTPHSGARQVNLGPVVDLGTDLFAWHIARMNEIVKKHGKRTIAWQDGAFTARVPKDVIVMVWHINGDNGATPSYVQDGRPVIQVTWTPCVYQPVKDVYEWNAWKKDWPQGGKMLGAQMVLWELSGASAVPFLRYKSAPRGERVWNPYSGLPYLNFAQRIEATDIVLDRLLTGLAAQESGLTLTLGDWLRAGGQGDEGSGILPKFGFDDRSTVGFQSAVPGVTIHYTLDGKDPLADSALYSAPFKLYDGKSKKVVVKACAFGKDGKPVGAVWSRDYYFKPLAGSVSGTIMPGDRIDEGRSP